MIFDNADLRYICLGPIEALRRIHAAVRDRNWGTLPFTVKHLVVDSAPESFTIRFDAEHRSGEIDFAWHGDLCGAPDGTIRFEFDGVAHTTFLANRIGCCVLHPPRECAGARCHVQRIDGTTEAVEFPKAISSEQPIAGFNDLQSIAHQLSSGLWLKVRCAGDVFETEDQRNWLDASFKTYSRPLRLPSPMQVPAGTRFRQSVVVSLERHATATGREALPASPRIRVPAIRSSESTSSAGSPVQINVDWESARPMPGLGLCASHCRPLPSELAIARLRHLNLGHLRVDFRPDDPESERVLEFGQQQADAIAAPLEVALHIPSRASFDEAKLREQLSRAPLRRVLVYQDGQASTPVSAFVAARRALEGLSVPIGIGTNHDLFELNQGLPPATGADFLCWSMNPQWHAFDNRSIAETPETAAAQVRHARDRFPGKRLVVSPVTLTPRSDAGPAELKEAVATEGLPHDVDARQWSLFGAVWTLAVLGALASAGANSVTFHATTGYRGIMEAGADSRILPRVRPTPESVFPLYHVFANVAGFVSSCTIRSSDPVRLAVLALLDIAGRRRVLLANLSDELQAVALAQDLQDIHVTTLDETNVEAAMHCPEQFIGRTLHCKKSAHSDSPGIVALNRHAIVCLDLL